MEGKIEVLVKAFGGLRTYIDPFPLRIRLSGGARLRDLLSVISETHPELHSEIEQGLSKGYINILIDGRNARFLGGLDAELADGTSVAFIPPVGGG